MGAALLFIGLAVLGAWLIRRIAFAPTGRQIRARLFRAFADRHDGRVEGLPSSPSSRLVPPLRAVATIGGIEVTIAEGHAVHAVQDVRFVVMAGCPRCPDLGLLGRSTQGLARFVSTPTAIAFDFDARWSTSTTDEAWARGLLDDTLRELADAIPRASEVRVQSERVELRVLDGVRDDETLDACVTFVVAMVEHIRARTGQPLVE